MTAVPLVFDSTVTAAYAAVTGNVAGAPPVDGVIGQKKVWAFRFDTTCPSDVTEFERQSRLKKPFGGRTGFVRLQNVRDAAVKAAKKGAN